MIHQMKSFANVGINRINLVAFYGLKIFFLEICETSLFGWKYYKNECYYIFFEYVP